jgi:uncharacterized protein
MNFRRINRAVHRDLGYFFFGMCIIYGLSGIALNHRHHWNPNFIVTQENFLLQPVPAAMGGRQFALEILQKAGIDKAYKTHLESGPHLRIFIEGGTVNYNAASGAGMIETIKKRPVFNQVNFLHYNAPRKLWTWFSDLFAAGLIILAISGLFVLKGKNGLTRRGVYFVTSGIIIPLLFLYFYMAG